MTELNDCPMLCVYTYMKCLQACSCRSVYFHV